MKRIISLIIALCLVLGSFSFAFGVDWSTTDQANLANIKSYLTYGSYSAAGWLSRIYSYIDQYMPTYGGQTLTNNNLSDIKNMLGFTGSVDLASALSLMNDHLDNIDSALSSSSGSGLATILENIYNEFFSTSAGGAITHFFQGVYSNTSYIYNRLGTIVNTSFPNLRSDLATLHSDLSSILTTENSINQTTSSTLPGIYAYSGSIDSTTTSMYQIMQPWYALDQLNGMNAFGGGSTVTVFGLNSNGHQVSTVYDFSGYNWRVNQGRFLQYINNNLVRAAAFLTDGFNTSQTYTNWNGSSLTTASFTPTSTTNGVYSWLSNIQTPIARLAFVHASDQEIEARQLAEDNQQAVVDDFIDPSGSGSVSASNFGSLSDVSGEMKTNFSTGQSASGVFNVFDDQHFGYLTQGTADSLDTSGSNTRLLKTSESEYPTPTLDRYYEELNKILEVNSDD